MKVNDKMLEAVLEQIARIAVNANLYNVELYYRDVMVYFTWQYEDEDKNFYRVVAKKEQGKLPTFDLNVQGDVSLSYKLMEPELIRLLDKDVLIRVETMFSQVANVV